MIQLNEGGSAVGGERIKKENIQPTVAQFNKEVLRVISPHKWGLVGSTGKKPENGDVDIGIETPLSFKEISEILSSLNLHHVVNTGLGEISVAFPQYDSQGNQLPDIVQIDLMIGDFAWIDFIYTGFSLQETKYKPQARTAVLYGLLRYSSEKQDGDTITFYSISPNRGAFLKQGKEVINKKGIKELKSDRVGEYIQDPYFIVETISEGTRHTWTLEELRYPFEKLWSLVKDRCPEEMVEKISKYAKNFLENIKIPVPEELINIESLMEAAKTAHLTHIEDKLYSEGKSGGEKIFMYLEALFDELKGNTPKNKVRTTLKVDGSPAILIGNNYPNISGPFVGTKMLFSTANPLYYQTPESIDAKYGDMPDLAEKLKAALRLAPQLGIPDGEIWKGDFLFTKKDLVIEEMDGEQFVIFQPNTLIYAVPANSEIGQKILSSDIGIAFHTKYTGDDLRTAEGTADFDVNVSTLTPPPNAFIIDANLPSIAGSGTMTGEETKAVEELLVHAKQLFGSIPEDFFNTLMTDPIYTPLLNMYENYMVRLASGQTTQFGEDVHAYLMKFTDWISDRYAKEADTKKTEKGKQQALARGEAIVSFVDQNVSKFISLFELQNTIVKIKNYLLRKMEQVSKLIPLKREPGGKLKITNNEGFAVSDVNGDIIKVVDRLGFSQANLLRAREKDMSLIDDSMIWDREKQNDEKVSKTKGNEVKTEEKPYEKNEESPNTLYKKILSPEEEDLLENLLKDYDLKIKEFHPNYKKTKRVIVLSCPADVSREVVAKEVAAEYSYKKAKLIYSGNNFTTPTVFFAPDLELWFKDAVGAKNKGVAFEHEIAKTIAVEGSDANLLFKSFYEDFFKEPLKNITPADISLLGGKNTRRTIRWDLLKNDGRLIPLPKNAKPNDFEMIGEALADVSVTVDTPRGAIPISIKSGSKVSFINAGIRDNGRLTWEGGVELILSALGFTNAAITKILAGWEEAGAIRGQSVLSKKARAKAAALESQILYSRPMREKRTPTSAVLDLYKIKEFLNNVVGSSYLMLHDNHAYWMSDEARELITDVTLEKILMPSEEAARLDLYFSSPGLSELIINIRSKQSTVQPTHMMCDYIENLEAINKISKVYKI